MRLHYILNFVILKSWFHLCLEALVSVSFIKCSVYGYLIIRNGNLKLSVATQKLIVSPLTYEKGNTMKTNSSFTTDQNKIKTKNIKKSV